MSTRRQPVMPSRILWLLALAAMGLVVTPLTGCDDDHPSDGDADADGDGDGDSDADVDDLDGDTIPPDGDVDTEQPRRLLNRPLFADMPIENRVYDPNFTLLDILGWIVMGPRENQVGEALRLQLPRTPTGQAVLRLPFHSNPATYQLLGRMKSEPVPMIVSVWVGRKTTDWDTSLQGVTARVLGYYLSTASEGAAELALDADTEAMEIDGIIWRKMSARLTEGPVAWAQMSISDETESDLYVTAPLLIEESAGGAGDGLLHRPRSYAPTRALTSDEGAVLRRLRSFMNDRLLPRRQPPFLM